MTARNRKRRPISGDRYYTPQWVVRQCVEHVLPVITLRPPRSILEPSAGTGRFVDVVRERFPEAQIVALDNDPKVGPWQSDASLTEDFLKWRLEDFRFDLVIGNPAFTYAEEFIAHSLTMCRSLVFLIRQGFLASATRVDFWRSHRPSHIFTLANRPAFDVPPEFADEYSDAQGDSADYCFACWADGPAESTYFEWLPAVPLRVRKRG